MGTAAGSAQATLEMAGWLVERVLVCVHVTASVMPLVRMKGWLRACRAVGIERVLALRGDGEVKEGYARYALEMVERLRVEIIREVAVGGYLDGHPRSLGWQQDVEWLKLKHAAGS